MTATSIPALHCLIRGGLGLAAAIALGLAACSAGMSGTYATEGGRGSLEFRRNGTVYMTTFGGTFACKYEVDGDRVIVKGPNGSQVLTKDGDRLDCGLGMTFVKR
jgi:hypothetical protein